MTNSNGSSNQEEVNTTANVKTFRKGELVKVNKTAYLNSMEAKASDPMPPEYIFQGPGELLSINGEYGQIRWNRPVPDVWLRLDQLTSYT